MRTDPLKDYSFFDQQLWRETDLGLETFRPIDPTNPTGESKARSFSGHERNRLFIQNADQYEDASLISGADSMNDSRGFVLFDFDRDGFLDMGITSPLSPRFRILRNTMGDELDKKSVFIDVIGSHDDSRRNQKSSSRDAIGAQIYVYIADKKRVFQKSCGEGFASQNSRWIHVGMGDAKQIDKVEVQWPSGKLTSHQNIPAGKRLTLFESGKIQVE